jgi:hypothetical protein
MPPAAPDAGEALFHVVDAAYDKAIDPAQSNNHLVLPA